MTKIETEIELIRYFCIVYYGLPNGQNDRK